MKKHKAAFSICTVFITRQNLKPPKKKYTRLTSTIDANLSPSGGVSLSNCNGKIIVIIMIIIEVTSVCCTPGPMFPRFKGFVRKHRVLLPVC